MGVQLVKFFVAVVVLAWVVVKLWWLLAVAALVWVVVQHRAEIREQLRARVARANCVALGRHGARCPDWHQELEFYS